MVGPSGQLYGEVVPGNDESQFQEDNTSAQYYSSAYYKIHKNQVQPIPPPRAGAELRLSLGDFVAPSAMDAITLAGQVVFHAVGDTGAAKVGAGQTSAQAVANEAGVADAMVAEVKAAGGNPPAFFFHLGDVVYNFGEGKYYYDQFFEPFRGYDRPIFAVPGNHDGSVFGDSPDVPQTPTLVAFLRNFCSPSPGPSPDGNGLVRSAMTQPGVYFTLDAPFVSVIGLYSNVLEGPGVISSQGGHYPVTDEQLTFLESELTRLLPARKAGKQAVVLALHHPPLSVDGSHGGSTGPSADIDRICTRVGLWPDLVLSGHAHLYQRFTRRVGGKQIPYIVSGSGGFAATAPQTAAPAAPYTVGDQTLEIDPIIRFGYLNIAVSASQIRVSFRSPAAGGPEELDSVTVDLGSGTLTQVAAKSAKPAPIPKPAKKPAAKAPRKPTAKSAKRTPAKSKKRPAPAARKKR
jgi:3',5'-cyclic AMP phosphodiesterase CpdA